jgi:hypothetical protein
MPTRFSLGDVNCTLRRVWDGMHRFRALGKAGRMADKKAAALGELIRDFDVLEQRVKDKVATDLYRLWSAFREEFGGLDGFLGAGATERETYLAKLTAAADKFHVCRSSEHPSYFFSVALMLSYARCWIEGASSLQARELGCRVALMIDRGRQQCSAPLVTLARVAPPRERHGLKPRIHRLA